MNTACTPHSLSSSLPAELQTAYGKAWYWVDAPRRQTAAASVPDIESAPAQPAPQPPRWRLQLGPPQPHLQFYYQQLGVNCACYLTACNPLGQLLSETDNAARMQQLRSELRAEGWTFHPGFGQDPEQQWPGEDSVLVWGMDISSARSWGQRWQQNAVLICDAEAKASLLWLR